MPTQKTGAIQIPRLGSSPTIDGHLAVGEWESAAVLKDFYQIQPGDNIAPSYPTEVFVGYDAEFLYLAFRAHDEGAKVRATLARRDDISEDDNVGIYLDTYNDTRKAYALYFNPFGVQADAIFTDGSGEDYTVDIIMQSKGVVDEKGYTVEVAIPFRSLRYEAGPDKLWGVHIFRYIKRLDNERDSWMPISRDKSGTLIQSGHITGLEGVWTGRSVEIVPTLTVSQTGERSPTVVPSPVNGQPATVGSGRFVNGGVAFDPGLNAKLSLSPAATLDLTINPDFAQVEADEIVVTANQRFPIFFPERRLFFLEGIDIFQTPLTALHTRAIVDPDYAVKLTGKHGPNTFGLLLASDNAPGNFSEEERTDPNIRPDIERFLDKNAYIGVMRLKRDIGKESSLGMIATTYNFIERHSHLAGVDGRLRINPQTVFTFQALGTTTRSFFFDPDLGASTYRTGNGFSYYYDWEMSGRNWLVNFFGSGATRYYQADVGFTRRTNTNNSASFVRYKSTPKPKARLLSWSYENYAYANFDWQGRSQNWAEDFNFGFNLGRQTSFNVAGIIGYERIFEEEFGQKRTPTRAGAFFGDNSERSTAYKSFVAYGRTTPHKAFSARFDLGYTRNAFDFDFGALPRFPRVSPAALIDPEAPLDPGPGTSLLFKLELKFQPTEAFSISHDFTKSRLRRDDTGLVAFDDNIYALRSTYQFNRFMFVRARVDYTTLFTSVRGQFLLGWTPSPGTSLFVGYNDDLNYNGFNPFTGDLEPGFRRNGRTFFVKMSYLFRRNL